MSARRRRAGRAGAGHAETIRELIVHAEADLAAAREANAFTAVSSNLRTLVTLRYDLDEALAAEAPEELTPSQIASAIAAGVLALDDDQLALVEEALHQRRARGRQIPET